MPEQKDFKWGIVVGNPKIAGTVSKEFINASKGSFVISYENFRTIDGKRCQAFETREEAASRAASISIESSWFYEAKKFPEDKNPADYNWGVQYNGYWVNQNSNFYRDADVCLKKVGNSTIPTFKTAQSAKKFMSKFILSMGSFHGSLPFTVKFIK